MDFVNAAIKYTLTGGTQTGSNSFAALLSKEFENYLRGSQAPEIFQVDFFRITPTPPLFGLKSFVYKAFSRWG